MAGEQRDVELQEIGGFFRRKYRTHAAVFGDAAAAKLMAEQGVPDHIAKLMLSQTHERISA